MGNRQRLCGLGLAALFTAGMAMQAQAQQMIVPILSCPFGCGVVEGNTIFGNQLARKGYDIIVAAQETPGYMYNLREMRNNRHWNKSVFGTEDVIIQLGAWGGTPELTEFLEKPVVEDFKLLHGEAYWAQGKFFISNDPSIKTIADMKGKRISLGLRGQSDWGVYPRLILEHVYGITPENSDIRHMTPTQLTQQFIDGTTDVTISAYGTDSTQSFHLISGPLRKLEASGKDLHYIPMEQSAIDKANEKFGTSFVTMTVKKGTLPRQKKDLLIGFVRGYKAVHANFPDDAAYQLVKAAYELAPEMKSLNVLWGMMTPEMMVDGLTEENVHPGALKAYKELGIWDKRKGTTPVKIPDKPVR